MRPILPHDIAVLVSICFIILLIFIFLFAYISNIFFTTFYDIVVFSYFCFIHVLFLSPF